jgi:hypothetical protein
MMDDMGVDFPFYFFALVGVREFVTGRYTIFIKGVYKRRMDGWLDGHTDGGREGIDTYPGILCLLLDGLFLFFFFFSFFFLFFFLFCSFYYVRALAQSPVLSFQKPLFSKLRYASFGVRWRMVPDGV